MVTWLPIRVLPDTPACAASSPCGPITTPCATMTRLSIFVPAADPGLAERAPVDRAVRADLDVVLDDDASELAASCGASRDGGREAEAVRPENDAA